MRFAGFCVLVRRPKRIVGCVCSSVRVTTMTMTTMSAVTDEVDTEKYDCDQDPEPVLQ
jgi:hypothetical protein